MSHVDKIGNRMKTNYENVTRAHLVRRMPVIIRIDGRAFRTFTRGFDKPFDWLFCKAMDDTTRYLCENVQNCVFGYTQSDEISLLLVDYATLTTEQWFDGNIQKISSIAASMATLEFNKSFTKNLRDLIETDIAFENDESYSVYMKAQAKGGTFDARVFNIPKEECTNYFYWRQCDALRNAIRSAGRVYFPESKLQHVSTMDVWGMLPDEIKNSTFFNSMKRGVSYIKKQIVKDGTTMLVWDKEFFPEFKGENRAIIDDLVCVEVE